MQRYPGKALSPAMVLAITVLVGCSLMTLSGAEVRWTIWAVGGLALLNSTLFGPMRHRINQRLLLGLAVLSTGFAFAVLVVVAYQLQSSFGAP